ncbi:hypothetical protein RZN22_04095, partial [Bacillaceae bacterium S4-13-58]
TQGHEYEALEPIGHLRAANQEASFTNKDEKFNVLFSWQFIPHLLFSFHLRLEVGIVVLLPVNAG